MGELGKALNRAVRSIEELGYLRAAHSNLLLFHEDLSVEQLGQWVDSLTLVNPSRVFVISLGNNLSNEARCLDESGKEKFVDGIFFDVGGRCHRVSPSVVLCSEVAYIKVTRDSLSELPSVLRAHMLSGARIEAVILQRTIPEWIEGLIGSLAQTVYIDSRITKEAAQVVPRLWQRKEKVVDCAWMWLAEWRDVIREIFDRVDMMASLSNLSQIVFKIAKDQSSSPLSLLLLAGWVQGRLDLCLKEVGSSKAILEDSSGRSIEFLFEHESSGDLEEIGRAGGDDEIEKISFSCDTKAPFLELRIKGDTIEGKFENGGCWAPLRRSKKESSRELLERFFLIGGSMTHYGSAFRNAVQFIEGGVLGSSC
jgi:hypothetical protein